LREQLRHLEELQRLDARLQEIDRLAVALPKQLAADQEDLGRIEALLQRERAQLQETEAYYEKLQDQVKSEEGQFHKSKQKLGQVKNTKEYLATQREFETLKQLASTHDEELAKLQAAMEQFKQSIVAHELDVNKLRGHLESSSQRTIAHVEEMRAEAVTLRAQRDAISKHVKPDLFKRYSTIRIRRGLAVVPVHDGVCKGCNMSIPPQLYNSLQRANTFETCPNCQRIIYWSRLMEDDSATTGA
jgi:hypothetical protein